MIGLLELIAILFVLLIAGAIYWYLTIPKNLPPGPINLPFIGSALEYRNGANQHLVILDHIKKYGPIFKLYLANKLVIVLGDYNSIQEALVKQGDVFSGRPQITAVMPDKLRNHGFIFSEGDLWKEHRRFALSTLRDFGFGRPIIEPRIMEEIDHLTEQLQEYASSGASFNPQPLLICAVSNIVSQLIFGRRFDYEDKEFMDQFTSLSRRVSGSNLGPLSPFIFSDTLATLASVFPFVRQLRKEDEEFCDYAERQMKQTIKTFDPDSEPTNYIHAYMKAAQGLQGNGFSDTQLLSSVFDLFLAGTETTSTTLRFGLLHLAANPRIQDDMYKEIRQQIGATSLPSYADKAKLPFCESVVMEMQRFGNLLPFSVPRRTLAPTKLMGYDIPEDTAVLPFLANTLHNADNFPDPMHFNPGRFLDSNGKVIRDSKLIPFGAGKRICLGESLARMELFIVLVGLITRFRFRFPHDQPKPNLQPMVGLLSAPDSYKLCVELHTD